MPHRHESRVVSDDIIVVSRPIASVYGRLRDGEMDHIASASPKRVLEFRAGRTLARELLAEFGFAHATIPASESRCPIWPPGILGSISHTSEFVAVAVTTAAHLTGIGLDIETLGSVKPSLHPAILTASEIAALGELQDGDATRWFSGKEAIYKAVNPICHEFVDYTDVSVSFDGEAFTARCHSDCASGAYIDRGIGRIWEHAGCVFTLFRIPDSTLPDA